MRLTKILIAYPFVDAREGVIPKSKALQKDPTEVFLYFMGKAGATGEMKAFGGRIDVEAFGHAKGKRGENA